MPTPSTNPQVATSPTYVGGPAFFLIRMICKIGAFYTAALLIVGHEIAFSARWYQLIANCMVFIALAFAVSIRQMMPSFQRQGEIEGP